MLIRLEIAAVGVIKMWSDILKKAKTRKQIDGNLIKRLIAEYLEETNYKDIYTHAEIKEEIFNRYTKRNDRKTYVNPEMRGKNIQSIKNKLPAVVMRYIPEGYVRRKNPSAVVYWEKITEDLEKIRTRSGDRLKLKDWEAFKKDLRAGLNTIVPRDVYGRKSSVRIVDGDFEGNKATLNVSFRSLQGDRRYIFINFIEEDGDYYFTTIEGNVQIYDNEVIQTEAQLREKVIDLVEEIYIQEKKEYDLGEKEEDELTEEENIRQLEAANPDSYWDRERAKLVPKEKPPEEQEARNLNLEEAAKLGVKAKEKADKLKNLLAERKRKKSSMSNIKPQRGKRGRKDVS